MPRKKVSKLDKDNKNDLRNYTEIDEESFWKIYSQLGNKNEYLKIVDNAKETRCYIWTKWFKEKSTED